jgi:hypothetical protein
MPNRQSRNPIRSPPVKPEELIRCPKCHSDDIAFNMNGEGWFAHSLEPQDVMNACILEEHQCKSCSISFWM